jgi:prepilin-type N-terminal cleavage/methylation domain-containing protein
MNRSTRPGMTLIELLVVIGLIVVLATLTVVYVVPAFSDNKNVLRGSDRLTSTLLIARSRALRDQAPRGVRFQRNSDGFALSLIYIEQPDAYRAGTVTTTTATPQAQFNGTNVNLFGSADAGVVEEYAVQPGDWLQIGTDNFEILSVDSATTVTLRRTPSTASTAASYKIIRQPRPISGETAVDLPLNVGVNIDLLNSVGPTAGQNQMPTRTVGTSVYYEVMFDPGGKVINRSTNAPVVMWVQDITAADSAAYNTTRLIVIYPRSGLIAAHPVNKAGGPTGYLDFALDGKSSGI